MKKLFFLLLSIVASSAVATGQQRSFVSIPPSEELSPTKALMTVQSSGTAIRWFGGNVANRNPNCLGIGPVDIYVGTDTQLVYVCKSDGTWATGIGFTASGGGGTVTSVSVATANGFAGTVATATTTPAITLSTSVTGLLKGDGTSITAATAGTDYVTSGSTNTFTNKTYDTAGSGNSFSINGVAVTANTGTGAVARAASPVFTGPTLGIALATSLNGNTFTTGTYTLTGAASKTLTFSNSLTLAGTDSTTQTFPATNATIARTDLGQTFSGANTMTGAATDVSLTVTGTQPVAVGSGTGTAAQSPLIVTGAAGGDTSSTTANTRGGAAGNISVTGGAGGQQTGASSGTARGGAGGTLSYTAGTGGAATAVTGTVPGGGGGAVNFVAGIGGTSATSTGGAGGALQQTGGAGGITTAAAVSGAGGGANLLGGAGGANSNAGGTSGSGGGVAIDAGAKGANTGGAAAGTNGSIQIGTTNAIIVSLGSLTGPVTLFGDRSAGNASAGQVGEIISSLVAVGSPVALSTNTAANVTTLSLTAGDWDVEGNINLSATTATITASQGGISITSATLPTDGSEVYSGLQSTVITETNSIVLPRHRVSISATTTVYMVAKLTFAAGSVGAFGAFTARRVR